MWNSFAADESGIIISSELVMILTIGILAMVVGLSELAAAVVFELNDTSNAIGALNQSYAYTGFVGRSTTFVKSIYYGTHFHDPVDLCDLNTSCDIVSGSATGEYFLP